MKTRTVLLTVGLWLLAVSSSHAIHRNDELTDVVHEWTDEERTTLETLWLGNLPPLPVNPSNRYSADPAAAALGKKVFFDTRFSKNGAVACATCHRREYSFTDPLPLAHGMDFTPRRSMPLIGMAYNAWFFWDGRKDSAWSQALGPPESPVEHGISRTRCAQIIGQHYRREYEAVFGPLPVLDEAHYPAVARPAPDDRPAYDAWKHLTPEQRAEVNRVFVNMGKAIAAYVRLIVPEASRFDRYVEALRAQDPERAKNILTRQEASGLHVFMEKGKCTSCHNGPLFTNGDFHNIGLQAASRHAKDRGRAEGIPAVFRDSFNCMSRYSDADPETDCSELRFMDTATSRYEGAMKTPTLRNVAERPPYMHAGQFETIRQVLEFYRGAIIGEELEHQNLTQTDIEDLEAFLKTLSSNLREDGKLYAP